MGGSFILLFDIPSVWSYDLRPMASGSPIKNWLVYKMPSMENCSRGGQVYKRIEGLYRNGKIELAESPGDVPDETPVIVTFLEAGPVDLRTRGIDERQAAELRARLATFAEEWDSPEMNIYDDYDAAKSKV